MNLDNFQRITVTYFVEEVGTAIDAKGKTTPYSFSNACSSLKEAKEAIGCMKMVDYGSKGNQTKVLTTLSLWVMHELNCETLSSSRLFIISNENCFDQAFKIIEERRTS